MPDAYVRPLQDSVIVDLNVATSNGASVSQLLTSDSGVSGLQACPTVFTLLLPQHLPCPSSQLQASRHAGLGRYP